MARILVVGDTDALAPRLLLERLTETIRGDGHDATLVSEVEDVAGEIREADAVVALLDGVPAGAAALVAYAHGQRKPVLGCTGRGARLPAALRAMCTRTVEARKGSDLPPVLQEFYEEVRPFAGRLVRDRIPELVEEAGHDVSFRRVPKEDLPRFLKRKIAEEAQALDAAAGGREKEELADLLEALEAFISARGLDREDLKRVKAHKHQERGGFTAGFVVEAATTGSRNQTGERTERAARGKPREEREEREPSGGRTAGSTATGRATGPAPGPTGRATGPTIRADARSARAAGSPDYDGPVWEADDPAPAPTAGPKQRDGAHLDDVGPERPVKAELRDL